MTDPETILSEHGLQAFQKYCQDRAREAHQRGEDAGQKVCPQCHGTGFQRVEKDGYSFVRKCACRRARDVQTALERAGIPVKFRKYTLHDPSPDERLPVTPYGGPSQKTKSLFLKSQTEALDMCRKLRDMYLDIFKNRKPVKDMYGLMLYGDCGRGKTLMVSALLCDLIHQGLEQVKFIDYTDLFKLIRFSFKSEDITYRGIFEELIGAKVLVIDDFGTEVSDNITWLLDNIGYIINERYVKNRPTLLTSNYWQSLEDEGQNREGKHRQESRVYQERASWQAGSAFKAIDDQNRVREEAEAMNERVSYRLKSRIREMCYEIKLEGVDYRNRISKKRKVDLLVRRS